jgi:hypothetical protein
MADLLDEWIKGRRKSYHRVERWVQVERLSDRCWNVVIERPGGRGRGVIVQLPSRKDAEMWRDFICDFIADVVES